MNVITDKGNRTEATLELNNAEMNRRGFLQNMASGLTAAGAVTLMSENLMAQGKNSKKDEAETRRGVAWGKYTTQITSGQVIPNIAISYGPIYNPKTGELSEFQAGNIKEDVASMTGSNIRLVTFSSSGVMNEVTRHSLILVPAREKSAVHLTAKLGIAVTKDDKLLEQEIDSYMECMTDLYSKFKVVPQPIVGFNSVSQGMRTQEEMVELVQRITMDGRTSIKAPATALRPAISEDIDYLINNPDYIKSLEKGRVGSLIYFNINPYEAGIPAGKVVDYTKNKIAELKKVVVGLGLEKMVHCQPGYLSWPRVAPKNGEAVANDQTYTMLFTSLLDAFKELRSQYMMAFRTGFALVNTYFSEGKLQHSLIDNELKLHQVLIKTHCFHPKTIRGLRNLPLRVTNDLKLFPKDAEVQAQELSRLM